MFKSKETPSSGIAHNALATGTLIKGNITAEEDFRIDGIVEGNINCKGKVVIGPQGEVYGSVTCPSAEFMGKVFGNVIIQGNLVLKSTCEYKGEVKTQTLEIEPGAIFNGTCKMSSTDNDD